MQKNKEELFYQVSEELYEMITEGSFKGMKLPPEDKLAQELNISRMTLRDILGDFEANGFIIRRKGVGTIINHHALNAQIRLDLNQLFVEPIRKAGCCPKVLLKNVEIIPPSPILQEKLQTNAQERVLHVEKVFLADDNPFMYIHNFLPKHAYSLPPSSGVSSAMGIKTIKNNNLETSFSELDVCFPPAYVAEALDMDMHTPMLHLYVSGYDLYGKPALFAEEYIKTGVIKFTVFQKIVPGKTNVFCYYDDEENLKQS